MVNEGESTRWLVNSGMNVPNESAAAKKIVPTAPTASIMKQNDRNVG
jgi:hypothetical protein